MISEEIVEDVNAAVEKIMKKEGFGAYKYVIEGKSEAGDNYMGDVIFLRVEPEDEKKKAFQLVLKTAKRSKELREGFPVEILYNKELFLYSDVFPAYRKLIEELQPDFGFDFVPKVYLINKERLKETIVMENLKAEEFKVYNRKKPWNLEHSLMAMNYYGKLHALSIALEEKKPELFERIKGNLGMFPADYFDKFDMGKFYRKPFEHVMFLLKKNGRKDLVKKYDGVLDEGINVITNKTLNEKDMIAICHMDCWNNNFMFKYKVRMILFFMKTFHSADFFHYYYLSNKMLFINNIRIISSENHISRKFIGEKNEKPHFEIIIIVSS